MFLLILTVHNKNCLRVLLLCVLLTILVACGGGNKPVITTQNGYALEVRGGTLNVDSSFFNPSFLTAPKYDALSETLETFDIGLAVPEPSSDLQVASTELIMADIFVSILKDGKAPEAETVFSVTGKDLKPTLKAGQSWRSLGATQPSKSGNYRITAKSANFSLSQELRIDTSSAAELLPTPKNLRINAAPELFSATWDAVSGAKSYLGILYDTETESVLWAGLAKTPEFAGEVDLDPSAVSWRYDFTLFAFSWDETLSVEEPYPNPLPDTANSSVIAAYVEAEPAVSVESESKSVSVSASTSDIRELSLSLEAGYGGPTFYSLELTEVVGLELLSPTTGIFKPNSEESVDLKVTCPSTETLLSSVLSITYAKKLLEIPVQIECLGATKAERILWRLNVNRPADVRWRPDGSEVAIFDDANSTVSIWDAETYQTKQTIAIDGRPYNPRSSLSWHPESIHLAVANGRVVQIFETQSWQEVLAIDRIANPSAIEWSPDGSYMALVHGGNSGELGVFNARTGAELWVKSFDDPFDTLAWSQDSSTLAVSSWHDGAQTDLLNPQTGEVEITLDLAGHNVAFSPDGAFVVAGLWDSKAEPRRLNVGVWDRVSGQLTRTLLETDKQLWNLQFSADGSQLAVLSASASAQDWDSTDLRILDFASGDALLTETLPTPGANTGTYPQLSWHPGGKQLAVSQAGGPVHTFDLAGIQTGSFGLHKGGFDALTFQKGGARLASAEGSQPLILSQGAEELRISSSSSWETVTWTADNKIAAVVNASGTRLLKVWNGQTLEQLSSKTLESGITSFAWSADGQTLAYLNPNKALHIIGVDASSSPIIVNDSYVAFAWSPDGTKIIASRYNQADILNIKDGKVIETVERGFGGRSQWLADDRLWEISYSGFEISDLRTGDVLLKPELDSGFDNGVSITISSDGKRLIYEFENKLHMVSLVSGDVLLSIPLESSDYRRGMAALSEDKQYLALGDTAQGLQIWRLSKEE